MARRYVFTAMALAILAGTGSAEAQNCVGRPDFDSCMAQALAGQRQDLQQQEYRTFATYLQEYGPWLQQQYAQYRGPMTFYQFAYWMMSTANGTNIAGATAQQQRNFEAQQRAAATQREGGEDFIRGGEANSRANTNAAAGWDRGAMEGTAPFVDPMTGQVVQLPYSGVTYNQPFSAGGQTYVATPGGYEMWAGSGWVPVQPAQ